ncbi:MAG: DUF2752 domain-containing protein [Planctomycetes bacterium]|nr:DUF2752 domain-containing protein [Planctomycetota bacterium]
MCAFKLWTGLPCPGCGMTRSVLHLAHGEMIESMRFHPLGIFVGAFVVAMAFGAARSLITGRDPVWEWFENRGTPVALGFVVALIGLWLLRTFIVPDWAPDPIGPAVFSLAGR